MYGGSSLVEFLAPRPHVINAGKLERVHGGRGEVDGAARAIDYERGLQGPSLW